MKTQLFVLAALSLMPGIALAQQGSTAGIYGTITDPGNAVVPGATITATHIQTGQSRSTQSNSEGQYQFQLLSVGLYKIVVEQAGFARVERTGVTLQVNDNVKVDVRLQLSSLATSVEVTADSQLVQTHDSLLREVVDSRRVADLPLNGRALADLAALTPGVVPAYGASGTGSLNQGDGVKSAFNTRQFTVNGSRGNEIHYTLDGGDHSDVMYNVGMPMPFPDAVQEFSVQTAGQGVDIGKSVGGTINVVTKSGTNEIRGNLFWFLRNTALNANNFFSKTPDQLKRNQTGFTLGGPILKNKLFAFGGYERTWVRQLVGSSFSKTMPAVQRQGDFSSSATIIKYPGTSTPYPGNRIPASELSPAMQNLLKWWPLPDATGVVTYPVINNNDIDQELLRVDYQASPKHLFYGRFYRQGADNSRPLIQNNLGSARNGGVLTSTSGTLAWTYMMSPNLTSDAHLSANYSPALRTLDNQWGDIRSIGVKVFPMSGEMNVNMSGSDTVSLGSSSRPADFRRANIDLANAWRYIRGSHSFIFGANVTWSRYNEYNPYHGSGVFTFNGQCTGLNRADAIIGCLSDFLQGAGELEFRRHHYQAFYVGDSVRATQRFTLNLGLRWEPFTFITDLWKRNVQFRPELYAQGWVSKLFKNSPPGLAYPGDVVNGGTVPLAATSNSLALFAPRFGFAWDVKGDGRLAVRGGYGLYYSVPQVYMLNALSDQPPFGYDQPLVGGYFDDPYRGREHLNVFPLSPTFRGPDMPFPSPIFAHAQEPTFNVAYTNTWNLAIERQFAGSWLLRVAYVGSKSTHLTAAYEANPPIYNPSLTLQQNLNTRDARRRMRHFTSLYILGSGMDSNYNGFQVSFNKRFARGLTLLTSYTWSKALDYVSNTISIDSQNLFHNPFNLRQFRGLSDWSSPHRFVESFVYQFPDPGKSIGSPILSAVARGWTVTGIVTLQAGFPFTVTTGADVVAGAGRAHGQQVGEVVLKDQSRGQQIARYFNTKNIVAAANNTYGNMGRNSLLGPGLVNLDTAIYRNIQLPFRETTKLTFRFEAFNATNRVNLSNPDSSVGSSTFGRVQSTRGDPRILQFALKLAF